MSNRNRRDSLMPFGLLLDGRMMGRDRLRETYHIKRVGLTTRDGDFVDAFYADRRGTTPESSGPGHGDSHGDILIICCEGNAAYPETGTANIALEQGYSAVAWNHPGFGSSSGLPFPNEEQNAVEACLLFAIEELKFEFSQIYLFGWSIGGYTVTWTAMNYPDIAGVILDATFDNMDELSRRALPDIVYPLVLASVHNHLDLNNLAQLTKFDGPVYLIRRCKDEIINLSNPPSRSTNCGNWLLAGLLKHRFPNLFTTTLEAEFWHFLELDEDQQCDYLVELNCCRPEIESLVVRHLRREASSKLATNRPEKSQAIAESSTNDGLYPSSLGEQQQDDEAMKRHILFFLSFASHNPLTHKVSRYFQEAPGAHCDILPTSYFRLPWNPLLEDSKSSTTTSVL